MFKNSLIYNNLKTPSWSVVNWDFIKTFGLFNMRSVWQSRYVLFNWAYSTNHKRISINYFWFVLFAGVVGMVLATIIRLEMAYPGVGILAGDNAQYLSIVTAHGVIMVFFMAMPMLFGFFGNFLLPTQLGVHDVAFPRMNSAAFWFLPASLLALCQLVCIDRRYQRMNCFNIRELQSLLRNRFFEELTPSFLKTHGDTNSHSLNYIISFFTNKTLSSVTTQTQNNLTQTIINPFNFFYKQVPTKTTVFSYINTPTTVWQILWNNVLMILNFIFVTIWDFVYTGFSFVYSLRLIFYSLSTVTDRYVFLINWQQFLTIQWLLVSVAVTKPNTKKNLTLLSPPVNNQTTNISNNFLLDIFSTNKNKNFNTVFNETRNLDFNYPEYIYKIKIGNYLPDALYKTNFSFLFSSINNKSIGGLKADWFNSKTILNDIVDFSQEVTQTKTNSSQLNNIKFNTFGTYNSIIDGLSTKSLLNVFNTQNSTILSDNLQQTQLTSLFFAQSKQTRVLNNWRELQLQREGWRCRMLSARHQRSLYRRYVNENELIWVVERNAKDLLPGWAMITPFSSRTRYTLVGKTDIGIAIVTITLIASMISSANFLMTYRYLSTLNNRKMRDARSFFSESLIAASWMMVAANPMLILGLLMLLSDRHWKTTFFDYSGGGDTILFQHMFWFFGHPEVYIIIVPCFGITNTLLSFYLRKRISARASLMYSLYTIAFLGFFVWGHHMYMVGLAHTTRMLYSTLTVMISVPAATKIMHWLVTFVNSSVHFELPLILTLFFVFYFVSGGISGMAVAHTGMNIIFHDTFYVIGHFHVMLAGSLMFAGFAAFYFYLPSLFGVRYTRTFAYLHVFYYSLGQIFTVVPMMWLGYLGMPRRVLDYPAAMGGWHSLTSSAHMITVSGILAFVIMLFDSLRKQKGYTIKTFGVGRYNTRLNFYLYQIARNRYWLSKHVTLLPIRAVQHSKNEVQVHNLEYLESTLFYYSFKKRVFGKNWLYL